MVSRKKTFRFGFLSVFLIAVVSAASAVWFIPISQSNAEREFRGKEARYLSEIKSLKLALTSNSAEFTRERGLAARLQQELQDANRQIGDLSRKLGTAQRTISQQDKQLRELRAQRASSGKGNGARHARVETTSALIVSRATSGLKLPVTDERGDRRVSRYSPTKRKPVRQQRRPVHDSAVANKRRKPQFRPVRVSGIGPIGIGRRADHSRTWPLSQGAGTQTKPADMRLSNNTFPRGTSSRSSLGGPKPIERSIRREPRIRRVAAVRPRIRRIRRNRRFVRPARLGRFKSKRGRRAARLRKPRRSFFNRMASRGVFGDGYAR